MSLVGSRGTVWGPVLGAFIIQPLSVYLIYLTPSQIAGQVHLVALGVILVLVVMFLPERDHPDLGRVAERAPPPTQGRCPGHNAPGGGVVTAALTAAAEVEAAARDSSTSLAVAGIDKSFGGIRALTDCVAQRQEGQHHRADRAQRLGQDDAVQLHHRLLPAGRRARSTSAASRSSGGGRATSSTWA